MPVSIVLQKRSTRLTFVLDLVFTRILGLKVNLVDDVNNAGPGPTITYGKKGAPETILIHDSGLLWEDLFSFSPTLVDAQNGPKLLFDGQFDLFAAVFWMVSEYEAYQNPSLDHHGRYLLSPIQQALGVETRPVVHLWVSELEDQLLTRWPVLKEEQHKPTYDHQITFDLDNPWKYLYKPLWVQLGGLMKAALLFRFAEIKERVKAFATRTDLNDTFDQIYETCPKEYTTFFILLENLHPNDSRFTWRHNRWRKRIREITDKHYSIGIHPSYRSMEIPGQIQKEKKYLEDIIERPTSRTRMHFLRYRLPDTRREMIEAGIREDFTPYLNGTGGFPNGMMIPYPWFDLEANKVTDLLLVPTILMDRTWVGTPASPRFINQNDPFKEFQGLLSTITDGNGAFVLCLHNECLSESGEWKNWSWWFAEIIRMLTEKNAGGRT